MAGRRSVLNVESLISSSSNSSSVISSGHQQQQQQLLSQGIGGTSIGSVGVVDPLRELFEACKTGDLVRVKKLVNSKTVNARDTAGRKSTPLHFAAG